MELLQRVPGPGDGILILAFPQIVTGPAIDIAALFQMPREGFGADLDLSLARQQVGQIDQPPEGDRIAVVHRRRGQRLVDELIRRRIDPARSPAAGAIAQPRPARGQEAITPASDRRRGDPGRPRRRGERSLGEDGQQEVGAVPHLGTRIGVLVSRSRRGRADVSGEAM